MRVGNAIDAITMMLEIAQLSEEHFFQWVKIQLEKRGIFSSIYKEKELLKEVLYEMLFYEQGMTVEDIENYFVPFGQAGYLTSRQKFEIILFVLEKDYGNCCWFLQGSEEDYVITEEDIEDLYMQWLQEERLFLSEEEKKEFFVQNLSDRLGLGILEVMNRVAPDGILLGSLCPAFYEQEAAEERIAVCSRGNIIRLPFMAVSSKEELIRIIKCFLCMEEKEELTIINPIMDFVKEDGTCITAVRPPVSQEWGIRILFGTARKEEVMWKK